MIGKTISHYKILEKLGEGGMGVVYKAEDTKLERPVALKFLSFELTSDPEAKKRFVHEAKTASALQHHNICTVHEIDETPEGQLFICMDYYSGETLKDKMAGGKLSAEEALGIAAQIAEGLEKAHKAGMVHRDIKPANIILTEDGVVKIVDFGLAKLAGRTKLTKTGATVGTAAYMSPEQVTGDEVDSRSDIFSLGVVLYEMLAGEQPFKGDYEPVVLYEILHSEPNPISAYRRNLPPDTQMILDKALSKDASGRYQSAGDLLNDLAKARRELDAGSAARAVDSRPGTKTKLSTARVVALLIVIAAIVAIVVKFLPRGPGVASAAQSSLAIVDFRDLDESDNPTVSAGITELVNIGLIESSPVRVVSSEYLRDLRRRLFGASRGPIEEDQVLEVARKSGATLLLTGRMGGTGAGRFVTWRLVNTHTGENIGAKRASGASLSALADEVIAGVLPLIAGEVGMEVVSPPTQVSGLTTGVPEAFDHYNSGLLHAERGQGLKAREELERAVAIDSTFALGYLELAKLWWGGSGDFRDRSTAISYAQRAWGLRSHLGIKDRMRLEAFRYILDYEYSKAISTYREMLERWPDDRQALVDLGHQLWFSWDERGALEVFERGLKLYPDDRDFGGGMHVASLASLGRGEEALRRARYLVEQNPDDPSAWNDISGAYVALGHPDSAETAYRRALELDPDWGYYGLSHYAYFEGDLDLAIDILNRELQKEEIEESLRLKLMTWSTWSVGLGALYISAGRYQEALEVIEEAERRLEAGPTLELNVGRLLLSMGRADEVLVRSRKLAENFDSRSAQLTALRLRARALAALGRLDEARVAVKDLYAAKEYWGAIATSLALKVEAEIALAEHDPEKALNALDKMKQLGIVPEGLYYVEHRSATARAYRMAGRLDEAARELRDLLRIHGGCAIGHYELGQIYEEMGRSADAEQEYSTFLEMWSKADEGLPQLKDARQRLASLRASL